MKKLLFVYNPKAGKAQLRGKLADIIDIFARSGYEITVYPTQKKGDAVEIVANRRPDYDLVVCSGGDGTLDEAVTGMKLNWEFAPRREGDIEKVWGNVDKANTILGWKADANLDDVLLSAWRWQQKLSENK